MLKIDAQKIVSHFNEKNQPVFFLVPATTENIKLQQEAKELHKQGNLKKLLVS